MDILKVKQNGVWTAIPAIIGPRGIGIISITKTGTSGLTDTYTITFSDNTTTTFTLNNGAVPNLTIGTVTEGATAAATITGTTAAPILNLVLPNANVPTRVSQLENDSHYAVDANYVHTDNNYTTEEKTKLSSIAAGAEVNVNADWNAVSGDAQILNKPTIPDIQINGASIVENGVANIPLGFQNVYGVLRLASTNAIKSGTTDNGAINPGTQHRATFYGLAKAAGDSTQSQSNNAVGTYTDEAKAAIQSMLGVPSTSALAAKQDALTFDSTPTTSSINPVTSGGIKSYVDTAVSNINTMKIHICTAQEYNAETGVPTIQNPDTQTFYLVPGGEGSNLFIEWVYVNSAWERFGSADVDLSNYVQKTDYATSTDAGVIKVFAGYGLYLENGVITFDPAQTNLVKSGISQKRIIAPYNQHEAAFYGLAKAAGDSTQSQSSNEVGTYTPAAKGAIQQMLGVSDLIATAEPTLVASKAYAIGDVFTANGKLYKATAAIAANDTIVLQNEGETISGANAVEAQIEGTFVKKTDYATGYVGGIIRVGAGLQMAADGLRLYTKPATEAQIKNGVETYAIIDPYRQHISAFYGLAKAAGDTTQSASSNAVGTYTAEAKTAIKTMLGITQTLTVTVLTQDNVTVTGQTVTVRVDDAAGEVYATATYEGQPVSFSVPTGFQYYVSVSDTLDHHFNPTTARGVITNTDVAVTLTYSDFSTIHTATDIKAALNAGMDLTDLVGEQITCAKGSDTLTWDVVDYDSTNKRVTLLLHDAFGTANMVFEPAQALMWCENGLAAGSYKFKQSNNTYYFTLTEPIPAGGQLRANTTSFWTYESQSATATIETGTTSTTEIANATDLGTTGTGLLNHHDRVAYGSNNYAESALYWWLNSDAPANTQRTPVTKFSRAYSYNVPGFLNGLDTDFIAALDDAEWKCNTNNVYECPQSLGGVTKGKSQTYTLTAKIGLASEMEIFGSYGGTQDGSTVFDLYNGATTTDRIKYRGTSAQVWWLRSPYWSNAYGERYVTSSGDVYYNLAHYSYAVVPAVQISKSN